MKNIKNKYIYRVLSIQLLALFLYSCSTKLEEVSVLEDNNEEQIIEFTQAQYDQAGIVIGNAGKRTIGSELKVNGLIDVPPHGKISINLPYGGFLKNTEMLSGTKVKKGQLLAVIENPDFIQFQQDYLENLAQREFLKAEYDRQKELFNEKVAAGKSYQQAKSAFEVNNVRVKTLGDKLKLIGFNLNSIREGKTSASVNIYSPISGSVREVYSNVGKYVNPQDPIMELTDITDLHVELSVFENDIPHVKEGQKIHFAVNSTPDQIREAEVFLIGSGVREDRSVTVHGHLKKIEKDLLPGMYVSAKIIIDTNEAWTVSEEAIVRFNGKHFIYTLIGRKKENRQSLYHFEMKEIIKGTSEEGYVQIDYLSDQEDISSDEIVQKGAFAILSKSKNTEE